MHSGDLEVDSAGCFEIKTLRSFHTIEWSWCYSEWCYSV